PAECRSCVDSGSARLHGSPPRRVASDESAVRGGGDADADGRGRRSPPGGPADGTGPDRSSAGGSGGGGVAVARAGTAGAVATLGGCRGRRPARARRRV